MADQPAPAENPSSEDFEEIVAAALKVDPKGLSGKHRREGRDREFTKGDGGGRRRPPATSQ